MKWLMDHIDLLTLFLALAPSVVNVLTKHYSEHKGFMKVLLFLSEMLSILTSSGVAEKLKLPFKSVLPEVFTNDPTPLDKKSSPPNGRP